MRDGLKILKLPGYYGPTRVGWVRRVNGDEYVLLPGHRAIWRTAGSRLLEHIAADGPGKDHDMGEPAKLEDEINRLLVWRALPADEKAWAKHCPKPKDWTEK